MTPNNEDSLAQQLSPAEQQAVESGGTFQLGQHVVTITAELLDVVNVHYHGHSGADEVKHLHHVVKAVLLRRGRVFFIAELTKSTGEISPDTRRWVAAWHRQHQVAGAALIGSNNLLNRAITTLMIRAIGILRRRPMPFVFVTSEAEAVAFIKNARQDHTSAALAKS